MAKKRLLTGVQPSGSLHIGNYIGALRPFVEMYEQYDSMLMVADYHALTTIKNPEELRRNTLDMVKDYLAAGVDPEHALIFRQSDIQEHTELAWIFDCLVSVPFLMQAHAYKDKVSKGLEASAGLFTYPMLMAADILLYDTDIVPVGSDQRQHIEYAREAAIKFNNTFGKIFTEPTERIIEKEASVPGTDGKKMSKSYGNTIPLFGSRDDITKAVMSIVTDSTGKSPKNVYAIHMHFRTREQLADIYKKNEGNYKALKEMLIEDIERVVAPMRSKRDTIRDDDVKRVISKGAEAARERARTKMKMVREKIGINL